MEASFDMRVVDIPLLEDITLFGVMDALVLGKRRPSDSRIFCLGHVIEFILPSQVWLLW